MVICTIFIDLMHCVDLNRKKVQKGGDIWGVAEGEMVGWHHQLNGREFVQTLGDGKGQRSLASYSPRGLEESDTT